MNKLLYLWLLRETREPSETKKANVGEDPRCPHPSERECWQPDRGQPFVAPQASIQVLLGQQFSVWYENKCPNNTEPLRGQEAKGNFFLFHIVMRA